MCVREREEEKEKYHAWIQNLSREGGGAQGLFVVMLIVTHTKTQSRC